MVDILTILNAESVKEYIENLPASHTIGAALFPATKQMGLKIDTIKGAKNMPIALKPSTFDVSVKIRSLRAEVKQETKEMPFFKESVVIKEQDRQNLLMAMSAANEKWRNLILDNIYGDIKGLVDGADVQAERMRMQLLSQGSINIVSADGDIVLDYGLPVANKVTLSGAARWSDPTCDPIAQLELWQDTVETATGVRPSRAICTRTTFRLLKTNTKIKTDLNPNGTVLITEAVLRKYLLEKLNIAFEIVSGTFLAEDGITPLQYYPDNKVTLLPEGTLGMTYYGTTPEEADLMTGNATDAQVAMVRQGVAVTTTKKADPVTVQTKVSQVCLPSFERITQIFIADVA